MNAKDYFKRSALEAFTASNGITLDFIITTITAMIVAILLGLLIQRIYRKYYGGVVYSSSFAMTLVGMTILPCALTLAISSNIVISLGMVGALSIVRYRTAIKDPVDLLYVFWSISIGIIVAARIYPLALITMLVMYILVRHFFIKKKEGVIYILVIHYEGEETGADILKQFGNHKYQIKSKTMRKGNTELTVELMSKQENMPFVEKIDALPGVKDVSLIQYNGEYNG
ncbi:DUF4956 domain-containing protein [Oribacterium sp. WCC10]|uniref:DUF4956 domain-containing protein n=1 Tax=Oribacterium sp. WCC10 TaxID=1855343 RepID=UPI0008EB80AA|nr:DUF4956 domain-containing protein [Oribacterium sp. WCC10]SFG26072.1 protein of unknown function [Oribacterium sp. WCC10]